MKKNTLVIYNPSKYYNEVWLPILWSHAKTYYEKNGRKVDQWHWHPCYADLEEDLEKVKSLIEEAQPDIFAVSLYVWNVDRCLTVAKWVKQRFPNCLIISGGPQQFTKHNMNWFKEHWYLDVTLPGDGYGELCFAEVLDTYNNGTVDWEQITNAYYPRPNSRILTRSARTMKPADKKAFDYQWSSYADQKEELLELLKYRPGVNVMAILETTRGCPYGCTYCDWGGGILSTVIKKDLKYVQRDLEFFTSIDIYHLFLADANLGIFGDRDIEFIQMIVDSRDKAQKYFTVDMAGYAKTQNKLDTIEKIIKLSFENRLGYANILKMSIQSLDPVVLKNIDRKGIDLEVQLKAFEPMMKTEKYPVFVEFILGLPGMTLDKFYHELDVVGGLNLPVRWYEWCLLPEAPAYDPAYRKQYQIESTFKNNGWSHDELASNFEIVVGSYSYTKEDYLQMLMVTGLYHAVLQGGLYADSIRWIINTQSIGFGQIMRKIYETFYRPEWSTAWHNLVADKEKQCFFTLGDDDQVFVGRYFIMMAFVDQDFIQSVGELLIQNYNCPANMIKKERKEFVNVKNSKKDIDKLTRELSGFNFNILKRKKWFGIFNR